MVEVQPNNYRPVSRSVDAKMVGMIESELENRYRLALGDQQPIID